MAREHKKQKVANCPQAILLLNLQFNCILLNKILANFKCILILQNKFYYLLNVNSNISSSLKHIDNFLRKTFTILFNLTKNKGKTKLIRH